MAAIEFLTDTQLSITMSSELLPRIGVDSEFTSRPHPGSGKEIVGWMWDERSWPSQEELLGQDVVPSIWDPNNLPLEDSDFQSGIGDGIDLKVLDIEEAHVDESIEWAPKVEHGYYYEGRVEGYLYSDDAIFQIFPNQVNGSGSNYVDLVFSPKPGIPIAATTFQWDPVVGVYNYARRFTKKASFTGARDINGVRLPTRDGSGNIIYTNIDDSAPEFVVESNLNPQQAILNGNYILEHGTAPPSYSSMEILGVSAGVDNEELNLLYSPVLTDPSITHIVSYATLAGPFTAWTIVSTFTGVGDECIIDGDLGIVRFNASPASHPSNGHTVAAHYSSTVALEYEAINTRDTILGSEVDINPLGKTQNSGFVFLKRELVEPYSITLEADLPVVGPDFFGPSFLGTSNKIKATVRSKSGEAVDSVPVTFTLTNTVGEFTGGLTSISSLSDFSGIARTTFFPPRNISALGAISSNVVQNAGKTEITLDTVALVGDATQWYIYKVFDDDPILGISDLDQYYIDYFAQEGITGPTAYLSGDGQGSGWEQTHRLILGLITPSKYNAGIRNGKKQLVVTWDASAVSPHYDGVNLGAFIPFRPESSVATGIQTKVIINGLLPVPRSVGNETLAGYFIVGPTVAALQASVYNERLRTTILSNNIQIEVRVPSSMDGTFLVQNLNAAQLNEIFGFPPGVATGTLPLGFRLKSAGVTLAAALDGLTYFDINRPTEVLGHAFTVK
jgi:hypothetical protein